MYEISSATCALIPVNDKTTRIIEENNEVLINCPVDKIINYSCKYFGSSYEGRLNGTKHLIKINYKAPIIIEETRELIFFPTASPRNEICHWLSLNNIKDYSRIDDKTMIVLKNDEIITIDVSYTSFDNQYLRATKLLLALKKRKEAI